MKIEIKNRHGRRTNDVFLQITVIEDIGPVGDIYLSKNGFYFLVQISDIIVISDGVYSREWGTC